MDEDGSGESGSSRALGVRWRLAGMMALIYMVQGSWWPMLAVHLEDLGLSGRSRGWIFATFSLAAIVTPLWAGQIADRWMPAQRLMALIYLAGTTLLAVLGAGLTNRPEWLLLLFMAYWLLTAPGYGLANAMAFRNLENPARQFGGVRLWGTVGWMVIGWVVTGMLAWKGPGGEAGRGVPEAFWVATGLSILFAAYCLSLPHTPPMSSGGEKRRGLDLREALQISRKPPVLVFLGTAFFVCLSVPFMYQVEPAYLRERGLPRAWIPLAMTINQVFEILGLAALPWLHRRLGHRGTVILGVAAWAIHYSVLAAGPPLALALAMLLLNGVGIACFIITGQMFLDGQAPGHLRATTQSLYVVIATGLGSFCGSVMAGEIVAWNGGVGAPVFVVPALVNLVMVVVLVRWFQPGAVPARRVAATASPSSPSTPTAAAVQLSSAEPFRSRAG